ncbi:NnrS family protein [Paucibacter sp. O1-1]|nr:NnrS family protein [Paucibacter sp. O1-1]MDA3831137.1 NnrS family protein [Paucibacter sp. O1-1]
MAPRPELGKPGERWQAARLLSAPHRLGFAAAALLLAGSALWWALAMLARLQGHVLPWNLTPATAHGLLMSLGFMPLFFAGFLFTAGPRWLACTPLPAAALLSPVLAQLCGWLLFLLAIHAGPDPVLGRALGSFGLVAVAWGWSGLLWRFAGLLRASRETDRLHAQIVCGAGILGALLLWAAALALASGEAGRLPALSRASLWGFSGLTFITVLHRMLPFFGSAALPKAEAWPLRGWLLLFGLQSGWALLAPCSNGLLWLHAGIEAAAGLAVLALALQWARHQSLRPRLLTMLHLGLVWLGLALLLDGLSEGLSAGGMQSLGLAPLHAYTMGFLGSILLAMVGRVSSGHSGRRVVADDTLWRLFWLLQLAVLLRIAAALVAAARAAPLLSAAALLWGAVCLGWTLRYGRWWGLPRADGHPD